MSNFEFLKDTIPDLYDSAVKSEKMLRYDRPASMLHARITLERMVDHIYRMRELPSPGYRATLADRMESLDFKRTINNSALYTELNTIRKAGNKAAHGAPLKDDEAKRAFICLFQTAKWLVKYYSPNGGNISLTQKFDPSLIPHLVKPADPLTTEQLKELSEQLEKQQEAHRQEREADQAIIRQLQQELAAYRDYERTHPGLAQEASSEEIADLNEAQTRSSLIDWDLHAAGWDTNDPSQVQLEYPVENIPVGHVGKIGTGYADYVLKDDDGTILAVIEAKRASRDPREGTHQAAYYAEGIHAASLKTGRPVWPVVITTNGLEHRLWDRWFTPAGDEAGYPERPILALPTREDLRRMHARRTARPLSDVPVPEELASRPYQKRAVRAVANAFDQRRRRTLLVMATGTGKTRTSMAIVKMLMDAGWVKRTLFLADRIYLVSQAARAYQKQFASELPVINLLQEKKTDGRFYASTYPTIENLVASGQFSPGFFDLIIVDEAHRSIYQKYGRIFEYFDALMVGLTATPKDDIHHDTYGLFDCYDSVPTDHYPLDAAVEDRYLVPPTGVQLGTSFTREGIRYDKLSADEKERWDELEWGADDNGTPQAPDYVSSEALRSFLFNQDTADKVIQQLMEHGHRISNGDQLGKTIIFAQNQKHAQFIKERFDALYPQLGGSFSAVITNSVERAQYLIEQFALPGRVQGAPVIAISVDMLDTGVDVPDALNLVFFKQVRSSAKYWQMIGRGTRLCPDVYGPGVDKENFYVFDCCDNISYFNSDIEQRAVSASISQAQRTYETLLKLAAELDTLRDSSDSPDDSQVPDDHAKLRAQVGTTLHSLVSGINSDSPLLGSHRLILERYSEPEAWHAVIPAEDIESLMPLGAFDISMGNDKPEQRTLDINVYSLQLALLQGDSASAAPRLNYLRRVADELSERLGDNLPDIEAARGQIEYVLSDGFGENTPLSRLEQIRADFRDLMRYIQNKKGKIFYTDFADTHIAPQAIDVDITRPGTVDIDEYDRRMRMQLRSMIGTRTVDLARKGYRLNEMDIAELQAAFVATGDFTVEDFQAARENIDDLADLSQYIRRALGLDPEAARKYLHRAFEGYDLSDTQREVINLLAESFSERGEVNPADLFEVPYKIDTLWPDNDTQGQLIMAIKALNLGLPQDL